MGSVYILTNESMPGLVKIGCTGRTAQVRADELFQGYQNKVGTGVPTPFEVVHEEFCENHEELERIVHKELDKFRNCKDREFKREFFTFPDPSEAAQQLKEIHKNLPTHATCVGSQDTEKIENTGDEASQIPKTSDKDVWRRWTSHFLTRYKRRTDTQQEDVYEHDTLS